jgi:hypothetical protein
MNPNAEEIRLADALVVATAAVKRYKSRRRAAGRLLIASSLLLAALLGLRLRARPAAVYVIRGDSTGVVLTGPGVARRAETAPVARSSRKGDRT